MASDPGFVAFVADQLGGADGGVTYRKMFGEYAVYLDGRVIGLVCDDRLYVKPTAEGRAFIGDVMEAPAYPGAKPSYLIEERIEDRDWLCELARITARALPPPRPKKRRRKG